MAGKDGGATVSGGADEITRAVMAGLDPAIHVLASRCQVVDARHKAGHDESELRYSLFCHSPELAAVELVGRGKRLLVDEPDEARVLVGRRVREREALYILRI
jgi:hypothetical protein